MSAFSFIASSPKLGSKIVQVDGQKILITTQGVWVKDELAEKLVNMTFPLYCCALKRIEYRKAIYYSNPTALQMKDRPKE